jgi:hypothetical protein
MKSASKGLTVLAITAAFTSTTALAQVCNPQIHPRIDPQQYIDHGDGTVTDVKTGLMWSACSIGQTWGTEGCSGSAADLSWSEALSTVQQFNSAGGLAGRADWRLPNIKELGSLVEQQCHSPAINLTFFPDTPSATYWSSTVRVNSEGNAADGYSIDFSTGSDLSPEVTELRHIRIVRSND